MKWLIQGQDIDGYWSQREISASGKVEFPSMEAAIEAKKIEAEKYHWTLECLRVVEVEE